MSKGSACKDFVLLMSAAVDPNGMIGLSSRQSLENREQQYVDTLKFYVAHPKIRRILFVENSNWDLSRLKRAVAGSAKVSWLSLDINNYPRSWGKGYGEMLLMDRAIQYVRDVMGAEYVCKVTGRFAIRNIGQMLDEFEGREPLALAIDILNNPVYRLSDKISPTGSRTIIYAVSCEYYMQNVYRLYELNREKYSGAEGLMYEVWQNTRSENGVYARFRHEPVLSGFAGGKNWHWWTANNYDGWLAKIKRGIRQVCRWVIPCLWI